VGTGNSADGAFYDMVFDRALIEASFAMQYGIRLAKEDVAFGEFCRLLSGLMADTPLGRVVAIRAEKSAEKIKGFGDYERGVRRKWRKFINGGCARGKVGDIGELQEVLERVFGA